MSAAPSSSVTAGEGATLDEAEVQRFLDEARECAMQMLQNAVYILAELDNVQMSDELLVRTRQVCDDLIGTKHDIIHEIFDVDDLLKSRAPPCEIVARADRIVRWLGDDVEKMHGVVMALEAAADQERACGLAYILVSESAVNILKPFYRAQDGAEGLRKQTDESRDAEQAVAA